jgi:hypothetical protein
VRAQSVLRVRSARLAHRGQQNGTERRSQPVAVGARDRAGWSARTLLILGRSTRARAVAARPSSGADARLVRHCGRSRPVEGKRGHGLDVAGREVGWQDLGIHGGR